MHWNTSYANFGEAASKPDGLAVVGVFLQVSGGPQVVCVSVCHCVINKPFQWCAVFVFFWQIGSANANLQKLLDAFDAIKHKVCRPNIIVCYYLHCICFGFFVLTPTYYIFFLLSGQTNRLHWLWPLYSATRKPGILDIWGLPDHSASAGERHLDCLQKSYNHQLWPGKAGSLPGLGPTVYNNSHILQILSEAAIAIKSLIAGRVERLSEGRDSPERLLLSQNVGSQREV